MLKKDILFGLLGGVTLYIPLLFTNYLVYIPVLDEKFGFYFLISLLIGGGIAISTLSIKNKAAKHASIRSLVMFISLFCTLAFNGRIGTILFLDKILGVPSSEATGRVAGLVMAFFLISILGICMITSIAMAVVGLLKRVNSET